MLLATPLNIVFFFLSLFIYLFMTALGLCGFGAGFFSLLQAGATLCCGTRSSHCGGLSCCRARALGLTGFSSCSMWNLPGPGITPECPVHWQADFYPLCHQGSPQHTLTGTSEIFKSVSFS